jgi:RNA polymerase sigma factor (TIGR02999 family)
MANRAGSSFPDQSRFMGYAARVMRGLIIDYARNRSAIKRGGDIKMTALNEEMISGTPDANRLADIGEALDELGEVEPELARLVDLKFFCGLSLAEIAALQNLAERTVQRRWDKARIYLRRWLKRGFSQRESNVHHKP